MLGNSHINAPFRVSLLNVVSVTMTVRQHLFIYFAEIEDGEIHLNELKNFMQQTCTYIQGNLVTITGYLADLLNLAPEPRGGEIVNAVNLIWGNITRIWHEILFFMQHTINNF